MSRKKSLSSKLKKYESKKVPRIPKHYFQRENIPPPFVFNGKPENQKHYNYKIYLGEFLRDNMPFLNINYEWRALPSFFNARHNQFVNYQPDIFVSWHDQLSKISFWSDIEINGPIHYKSREQILKVIERMDHIYPLLREMKEVDKLDYQTIASYIIIDKDDFEYNMINDIYANVRLQILNGGLYPVGIKQTLQGYLNVAK